MTLCVLCGQPCTPAPMADYDDPVCIRCDADHESVLLRMLATPDMALRRLPKLAPDDLADLRDLVAVLAQAMPV